MINSGLFTSDSSEWATPVGMVPDWITLDVCATESNAQCERFFDKGIDGLTQRWEGEVWCNPPYGREISLWIDKAIHEIPHVGNIVMLVPARTDTKWFQKLIKNAQLAVFIQGRLSFNGRGPAPFPSVVAILSRGQRGNCKMIIANKDQIQEIYRKVDRMRINAQEERQWAGK